MFPEYPDASTERWEDVDNKPRRPRGIVAAAAAIGGLDVFLALEPTIIDILEKPEILPSALESAVCSGKTEIVQWIIDFLEKTPRSDSRFLNSRQRRLCSLQSALYISRPSMSD